MSEAARIGHLQRQAQAQAEAGQPRRALKACLDILALQPDRPDVLAYAGTLALRTGDAEAAAGFYRRALGLRPGFVEVHYNLGNALGSLGRLDEAAAAYRQALQLRPDYAPAHHNLGNALRSLGQLPEAVGCYRRSLACQKTAAGERDLGIALSELGQHDEAIAAWRRSLALPDHRTDVLSNLANALLECADAPAAIETCERYLELEPGNIEARALLAVGLNEAGEREAAARLIDFDRFVRIVDFDMAPGYPSLAAFNAALAEHVETHPTLAVPPADHPTYHNDALEITGELLGPSKGPMAAFENMIRGAIARYLEALPRDPPHPFPLNFPAKWRLACWATRLKGQGNLDPHIHFTGYLGGVYYPLLPDALAQNEAGWFELGRPPTRFNCQAPPLLRRIQPKLGRLLLFPGYFYHSTVPFTSTQTRISVAFDLMPRS
jgi:tetratricopeptide (TPR) repeat protein